QPVLLVSHNFWKRRFAGDPGLVGRTLRLNGIEVTVIGIAPPDFSGTWALVPDVWVPLVIQSRLNSRPEILNDRESTVGRLYGRLRPGVARGQAQEEINALAQGLRTEFPSRHTALGSERSRIALGLAGTGGNIGD